MSSHREAPEISKDPVADNTDVYAFVSPRRPSSVTLIANFLPMQAPNGGPNFYEFGDDVLYEIHISNKRTAESDIIYRFNFHTRIRNQKTFLYNTGPITSLSDTNWNRPQYYSLTRIKDGRRQVLGENLPCPPVNVGPRSTPNYGQLAGAAVRNLNGRKVFAGQRADAFHVDLGSIFDLGALRPFNEAHLISMPNMNGVNAVQSFNVHTIALQVPITELTRNGNAPTDPMRPGAVIGVWATARRRKSRIWNAEQGKYVGAGPWEQVSRLGNPLVNEVLIPMAEKDEWNARPPSGDSRFAQVREPPGAGRTPSCSLPGCVPEPREVHQASGGPERDPAHRHPGRRGARIPELHRAHPGGHVAAQRRDPTVAEPAQARARRR